MSIVNQTKLSIVWGGLVSHKPLKKHISWWLQLLAIVAVPLLIVCTVIIAINVSRPDLMATGIAKTIGDAAEVVLNAAIEAAMIGCMALAKKAKREKDEKQARKMATMGWVFAFLTITTVGFYVFKADHQSTQVLLLIRCAAGIIFCIMSHSDDEEAGQESKVVQDRVAEMVELFNKRVEASEASNRLQLQQMFEAMQQFQLLQNGQISKVLERVQNVQIELQSGLQVEVQNLQEYVVEKLQLVEDGLQQSLIEQVSPLSEMLQDFSTLPVQMTTVTEEFQQMKITVERQSQAIPQLAERMTERVVTSVPATQPTKNKTPLRLPTKQVEVAPSSGRFNKTQFVLDCLKEDPEMTSSEIKGRAVKLQQSVTDPIISMARKDFKLKISEGEFEETFKVEKDPDTGEFEKIVVGE